MRSHVFDHFLKNSLQEVTDAQGRRRFHGAFTGGFSAGYYNTVGSAEGWAPSTFRSSRSDKNDTNAKTNNPQSIEQFLDEDELEELNRAKKLQSTSTYDTFGSTAAENARRAVAEDSRHRPSSIPGLLPAEVIAPVAEGIGIQLLQRMGWRQGKGIGGGNNTAAAALQSGGGSGGRRGWGRVVGVGTANTPLHLVTPKHDVHGLGFDPFKDAEEFRAAATQRQHQRNSNTRGGGGGGSMVGNNSAQRRRGVAFGTGVLDEDDSFGILDDYVTHDGVESYEETAGVDAVGLPVGRGPQLKKRGLGDRLVLQGFAYEIQDGSGDDDDDDYSLRHSKKRQRPLQLTGTAAPLALLHSGAAASSHHHDHRPGSLIPGFVLARNGGGIQKPTFHPPPEIPADYIPIHTSVKTIENTRQQQQQHSAPVGVVPPPSDSILRQEIEQLAFFVARNGASFEALAREQQARGTTTSTTNRRMYLLGGEGADFYKWKVATLKALLSPPPPPPTKKKTEGQQHRHHQQQQYNNQYQTVLKPIGQRSVPLSAEERGVILGEQALPTTKPATIAVQKEPPPPPRDAAAAVPLARSLLNISEVDRKRLAAAIGSTFVRAETQDMLHPHQNNNTNTNTNNNNINSDGGGGGGSTLQGGLRPGVPPPQPPPPQQQQHPSIQGSTIEIGSTPAAQPIGVQQQHRGIVTIHDLSRPGGTAAAAVAAGSTQLQIQQQEQEQQQLPVRRTEEWRPEPLLCKRLDVPDPYRGRPKETQASKFKADYVSLPATVEEAMGRRVAQAAAAATAGVVAPGGIDFLLPPSMKVAAEEEAAKREAEKASREHLLEKNDHVEDGDDDAGGAAEAFLSSLLGGGGGAAAEAAAAAEEKVLEEVVAIEKPMDLFKAIFEDSSSSEDEEEEEKAAAAAAKAATEQSKGKNDDAVDLRKKEMAVRKHLSLQANPVHDAPGGDSTFGFAKFRKEEQPQQPQQQPLQHVGLEALDSDVRGRVEAALAILKESKKSRKKEKKRKREKER